MNCRIKQSHLGGHFWWTMSGRQPRGGTGMVRALCMQHECEDAAFSVVPMALPTKSHFQPIARALRSSPITTSELMPFALPQVITDRRKRIINTLPSAFAIWWQRATLEKGKRPQLCIEQVGEWLVTPNRLLLLLEAPDGYCPQWL